MKFKPLKWLKPIIPAACLLALGLNSMQASYQEAAESKPQAKETTAAATVPDYLDLDGGRYMRIPDHTDFDIAAGGNFSFTAKVKYTSTGNYRGIIANRNYAGTSSAAATGFEMFTNNNATQFSINVNANKGSWNNAGHTYQTGLSSTSYVHLAWVKEGSESRLYVNGVLKETKTKAELGQYPINPAADILVGNRYTITDGSPSVPETNCFIGAIDDVRFFDKALTATELSADMSATVDENTANLIAAYDFSEFNGTSVPDISGNGHDGVLVNFPDYGATGSTLTIEEPAYGTGTFTVTNPEGTQLVNGSLVEDGTLLTVEATPAQDYEFGAVVVNGSEIAGNTFTMDGDMSVNVKFTRSASAPTKVLVYDVNEDGSRFYRIPALVVAADGSLVAIADKRYEAINDLPNTISVIAKRSTDGGETWSKQVMIAEGNKSTGKTYGDPAAVVDRKTGNIVVVYSGDQGFFTSTKTNRAGIYVSTSSDNGQTFTAPRAVTDQIYQDNWYGAFVASGTMCQTKSGRILCVANARLSSAQWLTQVYEFVCASDDGGQNWRVLNPNSRIPAAGNGNESKIVELSDGTLLMSIRSDGKRRFSKSTDGGETWTAAAAVEDLNDPSCNGDIIVYPSPDGQKRMLHSHPNDPSVRRNVSVSLSYDEGETWPVSKTLIDTYSAYSSLAVLPDGSIGCLVEEGKWDQNIPGTDEFRLYFMKFTLDWLTDGADVPTVDPVYNGTLNCDGTRFMKIPNSDAFNIAGNGKFTVSLKVKPTEKPATGKAYRYITNRVRANVNGSYNVSGFDLYSMANSEAVGLNYFAPWKQRHVEYSSSKVVPGEWNDLCWVYDGANDVSTYYINGEAIKTNTGNHTTMEIRSLADILVGAGYTMAENTNYSIENLDSYLKGEIDDVRLFSKALSADEVVANMTATVDANTEGLIAAYDFAAIEGMTVPDISGNGHDGELVNFPDRTPGYTFSIGEVDETKGSIEVFNGTQPAIAGRNLPAGTVLTVVPTALEGFIVKNVTVNGVEITPVEDVYSFELTENVVIAAEFMRDPNAPLTYCKPTGTYTQADRNMAKFQVSDGLGHSVTVDGVVPRSGGSPYFDRTETVFTTSAGQTVNLKAISAKGEWMHSYVYVDWGRDGEFDADRTLTTPNGDLVCFDRYSATGEAPFYDSNGTSYNKGHTTLSNMNMSFTIPASVAPGTYTIRYKLDWNSVNPCGNEAPDNNIAANRGGVVDFTLMVESDYYDTPRTITILSDNEDLGSVEFTNPASTESSITTTQKVVGVRATPAEGAELIAWVDGEGNELATTADYAYNGTEDVTLKACFGYGVTITSDEYGVLNVTNDGVALNSGDVVAPGTVLTVTAAPNNGCRLVSITANGELVDDGGEVIVNEATEIVGIFSDAPGTLYMVVTGEGIVEAAGDYNDTNDQLGAPFYQDGSPLREATGVFFLFTPEYGFMLENGASIVGGRDGDIVFPGEEFYPSLVTEGVYWAYAESSLTDLVVTANFVEVTSGIETIEIDDAKTEIYNLQGIRMKQGNIAPGVYLLRKGNAVKKVYIKK